MRSIHKQQGYSLFLVMILMLVIAFLVIATSQSSLTESRTSANEADRKLALSYAESGLKAAEDRIMAMQAQTTAIKFTPDCKGTPGMCKPAQGTFIDNDPDYVKKPFEYDGGNASKEAWERGVFDDTEASLEGPDGKSRYIIEYMGFQSEGKKEIFRVTSRAEGQSDSTSVTLQSYVELIRK